MNNTFITGSGGPIGTTFNKYEDFKDTFYKILERDELTEEKVCIILYKTMSFSAFNNYKCIERVYRTIEDFMSRCENDVKKLAPMYGVEFQVWIYD